MQKLVNELKNIKGFVLVVGYINNKLGKVLENNKDIEISLLTNKSIKVSQDNIIANAKEIKKGKRLSIKKIKKQFRKKRPDYIVCNINDIECFLKNFVKDSLFITNNSIYIYSEDNEINLDEIVKKYQRYIKDIEINKKYIKINASKYKRNIFKNIWYYIIDCLVAAYDFIGNILAS